MKKPINKIIFTTEMDNFLKNNFGKMTNKELADGLGLKLTRTRMRLYELGFKRMELEYWTDEQISFLMANYHEIGDVEIAEIFTAVYEKQKGWSKKHIEKKRRYLKLKRTPEMIEQIHSRNTKNGRFSVSHWKRWFEKEAKPGHEVVWHVDKYPVVMVKMDDGKYKKKAHIIWESINGPIPKKMNIIHLDDNQLNCEIENLRMVSNAEKASLTAIKSSKVLSDNYVAGIMTKSNPELRKELRNNPEIIELKRLQLTLNRTIKNKQ